MPLRFHRICAELAPNGWLGENVRIILLVQHIVSDMLNDGSCFFIIDQRRSLDDKLFRVELKLLENRLFNSGQNCNDRFSRQAGFNDQLANQVILYAAVGSDLLAAVISGGL